MSETAVSALVICSDGCFKQPEFGESPSAAGVRCFLHENAGSILYVYTV